MNVQEMKQKILDKTKMDEKSYAALIRKNIEEMNGLIDEEGATLLIAKQHGINLIDNDSGNEHKEFLNKWKSKLQILVDNPTIRSKKVAEVVNEDGTYKNLKFAPKELENVKEDKIKTGAPYNCYIFILSIKTRFHPNYGDFKSIIFLLWDEKTKFPRIYSCIPPKFISYEIDNNSYNTLYYVEYEGLKQSQTNENRSYHNGEITRIAKINKLVQSSL